MKRIITFLTALLAVASAHGRDIRGIVIGEHNEPIEFAKVVIYSDSIFLTGGITGPDGRFSIVTESDGALVATISFPGYESQMSDVPRSGNLGTISLTPASVALGEIEVKASRPSTTLKGNALVTTVEGSLLAIAGTANDVLTRVPMVIDNAGTLEVFGKGAPAVYINGRRVTDMQELAQLNSHDIKNVEVITNPGSAYPAEVKAVIRIRTKPAKGEGWSGTLRTDNGYLRDFRTGNSLDLKYRTGGLELFANGGWWRGYNIADRTNDMTTTSPAGSFQQNILTCWKEGYNDINGKVGFAWQINDRHSVGAYYRNERNCHTVKGITTSEVWQAGDLKERIDSRMRNRMTSMPQHSTNLYYNGTIGRVNIDFNADYLSTRQRESTHNDESAALTARTVETGATNRISMFAEKLVVSLPAWQGEIEVGQEFSSTHTSTLFATNLAEMDNADNKMHESNAAVFAEMSRQVGRFQVGVGLRYEHVSFDYYSMGQRNENQSKSYNNVFPSASIATQAGDVRMALNYSGKTVRPGYGQLYGTVSYINRLTYETGNPYLRSTGLQTVEYVAQWRQFFAQLSYTHIRNGVYLVTEPYGPEGEATIIRTANLPRRHTFSAFAGAQFQVGPWQTKVNAGISKQWLTLPVNGTPTKMNTPGVMAQWQNAVHLPLDMWLNVDGRVTTRCWDNNTRLTKTPWSVDVKLYKGFLGDALSLTLEGKDLFNTARKNAMLCNDAVQIVQKDYSPRRTVMLTVQYRFNTTRDRYRGTGAGNSEKSRF